MIAWLLLSWVVMTLTHELGHLFGGWLGGATLVEFDLTPWRLPFSLHQPDPHPLLTLWSGPLLGVLLPLLLAAAIGRPWAWFVADFCLIANGSYLAAAWVSGDPHLDTPRLMQAGANPLWVGLYCLVTIGVGYLRFRRDCVNHFEAATAAETSHHG